MNATEFLTLLTDSNRIKLDDKKYTSKSEFIFYLLQCNFKEEHRKIVYTGSLPLHPFTVKTSLNYSKLFNYTKQSY